MPGGRERPQPPILTYNPPSSVRRPRAPSDGRHGLSEPGRPPGAGTATGSRATGGPSPPCLFKIKARTPRSSAPPPWVVGLIGNSRGALDGRAGPCCKHAASLCPAQIPLNRIRAPRTNLTPSDPGWQRESGRPREHGLFRGSPAANPRTALARPPHGPGRVAGDQRSGLSPSG